MPKFTKPLSKLGYINGVDWLVESEVEYQSDILPQSVVVEKHTATDLASIPRALWWAYPPTKYAEAAVIHDELYRRQTCTRAQADAVFKEALLLCGFNKVRANLFYASLRVAGWKAWRDHAKRNRIEAAIRAAEEESQRFTKEDFQ